MNHRFSRRQVLVALGAMALAHGIAEADDPYPARPVRIIVPYGPGTGTDLLARYLAERLNDLWQRGVVVENSTGAGGVVGTQALARSAPDGYTLGLVAATHVINGAVYANLSYHPVNDFVFLVQVSTAPLVLVAPAGRYANLQDLLRQAREKPNVINYGSVGHGSVTHLAVDLLQKNANVRMQHVPHRAPGQLMPALISGEVTLAATAIATALLLLKGRKLAALATCSAQPARSLPDVPPVSKDVPGHELTPWVGLIAPKGLPSTTMRRIEESVAKVAATPEFDAKLQTLGLEVELRTGAEFAAAAERDLKKYRDVVAAAGIGAK